MKKILIIEDDPFLSEMYTTKLTQSGFEVEKGIGLGADEYIIKAHFTPTAVMNKISKILSNH